MATQQQITRSQQSGNNALVRRNGSQRMKDAPWHSREFVASQKNLVTNFLGWFSIGLGVAELVAPGAVARLIGVDEEEHTTLFKVYGAREIMAGVGILTRPKPTYWVWNRVLGDGIDLASLGRAAQSERNNKSRLWMAMLAVVGVTALDIVEAMRLTSESSPAAGHDPGSFALEKERDGEVIIRAAVTINRPLEEVRSLWNNRHQHAEFMQYPEQVQASFRAARANRGTVVTLEADYRPKLGAVGAAVAKTFRMIPQTQLANDLRRFKQIVEVGEVVKSDASAVRKMMQPARPPKTRELEEART